MSINYVYDTSGRKKYFRNYFDTLSFLTYVCKKKRNFNKNYVRHFQGLFCMWKDVFFEALCFAYMSIQKTITLIDPIKIR